MLIAAMMARDEADIIGHTVAHLFEQGVDRLIVADNGSSDETYEILLGLQALYDIDLLVDDEVGYYQDRKMTALAERAVAQGADWVLPCDADELWLPIEHGTVAEALSSAREPVVLASEWRYWPAFRWKDEPNPYRALQWREEAAHRLSKVAFRAEGFSRLHMGNHDVDHTGGRQIGVLKVCHFPYRSFDQFRLKVRNGAEAYEAAKDLHPGYGTHWREMGAMSDDELLDLWGDAVQPAAVDSGWLSHGPLIQDPAL